MAQTRSQKQGSSNQKSQQPEKAKASDGQDGKQLPKKRVRSKLQHSGRAEENGTAAPKPKKAKKEQEDLTGQPQNTGNSQIEKVINRYGTIPLSDTDLSEPTSPTPETILALVFHAMLTSARISHELAYKSVRCLIEVGYHNVEALSKSSWQERTEVLTKGGYTRYREKTATALGELAEFVKGEFDGDLNNIGKRADSSPSKIRGIIKSIKGIGNVGTDIFFDTAQGVWPCLAPFIDPRSLKTAEQCGLGSDVDQLWEATGRDPLEMCKLASALTAIRLNKKEKEFL